MDLGLIAEWREGVIETERVTPANPSALLVGRLMRDVVQLLMLVQALILVGLGLAMGIRGSAGGILLGSAITCRSAARAPRRRTRSR